MKARKRGWKILENWELSKLSSGYFLDFFEVISALWIFLRLFQLAFLDEKA